MPRRVCGAPRWLCVAVLLTGAVATATCPPAGASLPRQRNVWASLQPQLPQLPAVCPRGAPCLKPWEVQGSSELRAARFFGSSLARAAVATHWPDAWRPLLAKLRADQPITVLAFGSSIVADLTGCFASGDALAAAGVAQAPPPMRSVATPGARCATPGFVANFMAAVNATWPHARHLYVNAGRGATDLDVFARFLCVDPWLPTASSVDILLMESHEVDWRPEEAAQVVRQVETLFSNTARRTPGPPPALVMLNAFPVTDPATSAGAACMGDFGQRCASCGSDASAALAQRLASAFPRANSTQDTVAAAARRYGWTSLSLRDALLAGLRDGAHTALGWSECEWLNGFLSDRVHPSPQASRLLADALIGLLVEAQDAADAACGDADEEMLPVALPPWAPLSPGAFAAPLRLCNDASKLEPRVADGWSYVKTELVRNRTVAKPGWIATQPGAVLEFAVTSRFAHTANASAAAENATLAVTFLTSYEHMGDASLACVDGCACDGATLEGHVAAHVSLQRTVELPVSQASACVLRLVVLPTTASGEHKVKLIDVAVNAPPGLAAALQADVRSGANASAGG